MTNWHDPVLEVAQGLALVKLIHVVAGVYFWEFVLNFDYEYSLITGKRQFRRGVPLYLGCRWSTLLALIVSLINLDTSDGIDCQAWAILIFVSLYFAVQSASCLVILRIRALWERKIIVTTITYATCLANTAAFGYNIAITRAHRQGFFCDVDHISNERIAALSVFTTDIVLLSLTFFGVLRWKQARLVTGGISWLMYMQGLIYVGVATLVHIPSVTFLLLDLNEPMDQIFPIPSLTIMSICALRMHRGLVDSAAFNGPPDVAVCSTTPSTIHIAIPILREDNTCNTGCAVSGPCPQATASPERISSYA